MWKIVVGFIAFAALALFILSQGGDIDMSGEKHGVESHSEQAAPAAPAAPSEPAAPAAPADKPADAKQ
ncbi:hypothetical protein METUNv1_03452 [Methyloversatilis universalis FAM5]|jgi:hypothetical protein|uniref:Uncharacterized protein n=1 Tax=Methyloversatilis universalis (strain ATCC BAA-1314 / DSM 25237 / JCM 13912 / CCUG 52030 / FAM5) TaxID=1000565 RepID=F5RG57_METUF|nr:hypothetical protein [Methyloversatilis universalis]EGK70545.1 hypothetical protein METUNv1_03452 [Methyloversatilis universalis FAM5]